MTELRRLAPLMHRYPLDVLGANNGQQLFVNDRHRPADEWILSLKESDADTAWRNEVVRRTGWDLDHVMGTLTELLREDGFKPAPAMPSPLDTLVNHRKTVKLRAGRFRSCSRTTPTSRASRSATRKVAP